MWGGEAVAWGGMGRQVAQGDPWNPGKGNCAAAQLGWVEKAASSQVRQTTQAGGVECFQERTGPISNQVCVQGGRVQGGDRSTGPGLRLGVDESRHVFKGKSDTHRLPAAWPQRQGKLERNGE